MPSVRPSWPPRRIRRAALLGVLTTLLVPAAASAADLNATPANLTSVVAAAQPGDTVHLAAGDYGTFDGAQKAGTVTLTGTGATMVANLGDAKNLTLDGLTLDGMLLDGATGVTIRNATFTAGAVIDTPVATPNANILLDHDTFSGIDVCSTCNEGRLTVRGYENTQPAGVTISNSLFGPGGDADGIQIIGGAYGVQIGPGNELRGLAQVDATHTDAIQLYGSSHTLITGNWMHDNATGIMAPDTSDHETITNNVISTTSYPWPIVLGGADTDTVSHNTLPGSAGTVEVDVSNSGVASTSNIITNNVLSSVTSASGGKPQGATVDYNLISTGTIGAHDLKGKPAYAGGAAPTAYAGFALAATSPGHGAAGDGQDMGIVPTPPAAPTPVPLAPPTVAAPAVDVFARFSALRVAAASRFAAKLTVALPVPAGASVARAGFWLDNRWLATDRTAPYRLAWATTRRTALGAHTVSVRLFAPDGRAGSVAVTVRRVRAHATATKAAAWRLTTQPSTSGSTRLSATGPAHHRVAVTLARCADAHARTIRRATLRADGHGRAALTLHATALCALRLRPLSAR